jgi:hypothetical protein
MFFDKLLDILRASNKIGFALLFAGSVMLIGQAYHLWPYSMPQEQLGYVLFATLLGGGVLLASFLAGAGQISAALAGLAWAAFSAWRLRQNVMSRLSELLPRDVIALYWIANHKDANVHGDPISHPFLNLRSKGFLSLTDKTLANQTFRVNPRVYSQKDLITKYVPAGFYDVAKPDRQAPWLDQRRV